MKTSSFVRSNYLRLVTVIVAGLLTVQCLYSQSWYNPGWPYRSSVSIAGLAVAQTDFQVKVTPGGSFDFSNTLNDGSDIRITSADGTTLLPYWIEEWDKPGMSGTLWVRVPDLPTTGLTLYIYYGNPAPSPSGELVETPPAGPFTKNAANPGIINGAGAPLSTESILPENIVYDPDTQLYWMVLSDQTGGPYVGLVYSNDPSNPDAWYWSGYPISGNPFAIAPHLMEHDGTWYIFYGDRAHGTPYPVAVASSPDVDGPYTYLGPVLPAGAAGTWEDTRADEPTVFWNGSMNKWIMMYMGDSGGNVEQVGYATADNITGPYTKYAGNPCIPFGPAGTFDAGTVADPWVYEYHGVYYIGYTVSPTTSSPWQTALATTTDWVTFTKHGVILPTGSEFNSFRGAVTRIGDEYVFPYTGGPASGVYRLCIATQPVYQYLTEDITNNGDAVFDFFDGFDGSGLNLTKWSIVSGPGLSTVAGGLLTMNATATYILLRGTTPFGPGYTSETRARHPSAGVFRLIAEFGFSDVNWNAVRIADYYLDNSYWQRQSKVQGGADDWINMARTADSDWHQFSIYRESAGTAGFRIDDYPVETTSVNVPSINLSPFLMSYGNTSQVIVDWTRIRKWAGADPVAVTGPGEGLITQWTGTVSSDWNAAGNWTAGVPGSWSNMTITSSPNNPVFSGSMILDPSASLTIDAGGALTVSGDIINNGQITLGSTLTTSGSLIVGGALTGNITYNRQLKTGVTAGSDWHLAASPVAANAEANTGKVNGVYQWSEVTGAWTNTGITSALPGHGYNIRQEAASDGAISFRGPIVNTDISVGVSSPYADAVSPDDNYFERTFVAGRSLLSPGGKGWNLLGNPYPSAIRVDDFIAANYNPTPSLSQFDPNYVALYLFDGTARRYYYLANSTGWPSGLELNETHVQAGQGFFVLAMNDNSEFRFTKTMQEHSTGTAMLKSGNTDDRWPGLQLKIQSVSGEVFTTVVYGESMSTGVDPGYDIGLYRSGQGIDLYTKLVVKDNGVLYARQALPSARADTIVVPVGVDFAKGGDVVFSALTVPVGNRRFWLEDRATGIFTELDLKSYSVNLPANTSGTGRFYLVASSTTPTHALTPEVQSGLQIWAVNGKVVISGTVSEGAVCEIFDLKGRTLSEVQLSGGELNTIDLPYDIHGIHVVRIVDGIRVTTRKVLIP